MPDKFIHKVKFVKAKVALAFEPKWRQITLVFVAFMLLFAGFGQLVFVKNNAITPVNTKADARPLFGMASHVAYKDYAAAYGGNINKELDMIQAAGSKWVRLDLSMAWSEPNKGAFDENYLSQVDSVVNKITARNMNILFVTDGSSIWANPKGKGYPPANLQDYADWLTVVVNRYRTRGVHAWEVWNEPNLPKYWGGSPNAAQYVALLKVGYSAIKSADSSATVVSAGLAQGGDAVDPVTFLKDMYTASLKGNFDKIGFHPYTSAYSPDTWWTDNPHGTFAVTQYGIRQAMIDNGDDAKSIWITEMGYSTYKNKDGSIGPYGVDESTQATYLKRAYDKVATDWPFVELMFWYDFRSPGSSPASFEDSIGIVNSNYTVKTAYDTYSQAAAAFAASAANPTPVPTSVPSPTSTIYEAESATLAGASIASNQSGYTGKGFVDYINSTNDYIEWMITNQISGQNYDLLIRYANGSLTDRSLTLNVNGVAFGNISFLPTGSWTTWQYAKVNVPFNASVNNVRLTASGQNGPNIDSLKIESATADPTSPVANTYGITVQAKLLKNNTSLNCTVDSSNGFGGTTNFTIFSNSVMSADITAPQNCGGHKFYRWSTGSNKTTLNVNDNTFGDNSKIYIIYYR